MGDYNRTTPPIERREMPFLRAPLQSHNQATKQQRATISSPCISETGKDGRVFDVFKKRADLRDGDEASSHSCTYTRAPSSQTPGLAYYYYYYLFVTRRDFKPALPSRCPAEYFTPLSAHLVNQALPRVEHLSTPTKRSPRDFLGNDFLQASLVASTFFYLFFFLIVREPDNIYIYPPSTRL